MRNGASTRLVTVRQFVSGRVAASPGNNPMRGVIAFIGFQACMVVDSSMVHHLGGKVSVDQITFVRGVGTAALVALLGFSQGATIMRTRQLPLHLLRGILTLVSLWGIFYALAHLPLADAAAINYSRALFMTLFGILWFGETVSGHRWLATIASLSGTLMIIGPGFSRWDPIYLIALGGAALNAMAVTATKHLGHRDAPLTILAYLALVSMMFSLSAIGRVWPWDEWATLSVIGASAGLGLLLGQLAVRDADMSLLAPYDYVRLPLVMLLGFWIFGEVPTVKTFAAAVLILASGTALWRHERRRCQERCQPEWIAKRSQAEDISREG
jgi:drug/metabolite transporter (DMT)-like permease